MGYGFEYSYRQAYNGYYVIEKGGDVDGYHSNMWLLPNEDVGIFLIFNKDHDIRLPFFEAFMNHYYPAAQTAPTFLHPSKTTLEKFEGAYKDLRNNMWTTHIEAADGKLIVKDPLGKHTLRQIEPLLFQDENGFKAGFKLDDNQQVQAFYYDMKMDSWSKKLSNPAPYSDIDHDHPYASYIYHLRQLDVYDDEGETLFQPEQPITRAQFVGWFIRWAGIAPSNKTPVFNDVSDSDYAKEIQAAYDFGIIKGSEDGKFYPQKIITRQEAALIVWRLASNYLYAKPLEAELKGETDEWALEGVRYVVAKSLYGPEIENTDSGAVDYQSKQPLLKQEAAALLSAFADNLY